MQKLKSNKAIKISAIILISVLALSGILLTFWKSQYYNSTNIHVNNVINNNANFEVQMPKSSNYTVLLPKKPNNIGVIFFQGAGVENLAYFSLLQKLAEQNYLCVLVDSDFRIAIIPSKNTDKIFTDFEDKIDTWVVGGHSLGGIGAADFAQKNASKVSGIFLLGSYFTKDFSNSQLKASVIFGNQDLVLNQENFNKSKDLSPKSTEYFEIIGGNHAQFGTYGEQKGDGIALISSQDQQYQTINQILKLIKNISYKKLKYKFTGEKIMNIKKLDINLAVAEKAVDSSIIIIDVREPDEFLEKKLNNTINIPLKNILNFNKISDLEKYNIYQDSKIFVHCASGVRSENASKHLVNLGFSDVTNIGGINNIK